MVISTKEHYKGKLSHFVVCQKLAHASGEREKTERGRERRAGETEGRERGERQRKEEGGE